jgi:hypothetical protein
LGYRASGNYSLLLLADYGHQGRVDMRPTVKELDRRQEETDRRVAAIEAELREFRRLVPDYLKIHGEKK